MNIEAGKEIELVVDKLAFGGRGLSRVDGFVVFIERGLPGQKVSALVTKVKKGFAEARVVRVIEQSPDYTPPFCPHFEVCGGCAWQDLDYAAQLRWKREHVIESLARLAGIGEIEAAATVPSPMTRHFRNKMEFAFIGNLHLGLHERENPRRVFDVEHCSLMSDFTMALVRETLKFCRETGQAAFHGGTGNGFWRYLVVREGKNTGQRMAQVITGPMEDGEKIVLALGEHLTRTFPELTTFVHSIRTSRSAYAIGEKTVFTLGPKAIEERLGGVLCQVSPDSFLQTNTAAAGELYRLVTEAGAFTGEETIWDLYAGSGGVALTLASKVKRVIGVESSETAVADAKKAMLLNGVNNCEFMCGDVLETLSLLNDGVPDAVILDPPRGGTHPEVAAALAEIGPAKIIYISCNPATLARDAALLLEKYRAVSVTPVDLFPHSPHVECVMVLEKKN